MIDIPDNPANEPPERTPVFVCPDCGETIYEGDYYYEIMDEMFCEECIKHYRHEAVKIMEEE